MNDFVFDKIEVGFTQNFKVKIHYPMMEQFLKITGDSNPLHTNSEYAKSKGYDDVLVYGMLTSSFYSKLVGFYLPGKYAILENIEISFHAPVFIGDILTISGVVKNKYESVCCLDIRAKIVNQSNCIVNKAKILVGFLQ